MKGWLIAGALFIAGVFLADKVKPSIDKMMGKTPAA